MKLRLFILSGLCAWIGVSCGGKKENTGQESIRPVRVVKVESLGAMQKMYTGVVQAEEYSKLAFKVSGRLVEMNVDAGQKVKKGTVIAAVDPLDYNLQFEANKAAYVTSKLQMERNKKLLAMQAISKQDYEIAEANYVKAKSAYELSTNNMRDTKLLAPFDGSIEKRLVENYQRVNSGEGIVRLVNTQKLRIKFTVPDDYLYLLRAKDATFKVEFDTYKGNIFNARMEEYLDISTDGTGIPVTITIDDPAFDRAVYDVKPGFTCNIRLASDIAPFIEEKLMNVPLSAVFGDSENKNTYVWVVKDNRVSRREVTVYSPTGEANLLISKGLKPDETVVIAGVYQLVEGQRVKEVE